MAHNCSKHFAWLIVGDGDSLVAKKKMVSPLPQGYESNELEKLESLLVKALEDGVIISDKFTRATEQLLTLLKMGELVEIDKADVLLKSDVIFRWIKIYLMAVCGRRANEKIDEIIRKKGLKTYRSELTGLANVRVNVIRDLRNPSTFKKQLEREEEVRRDSLKRAIGIIEKLVSTGEKEETAVGGEEEE